MRPLLTFIAVLFAGALFAQSRGEAPAKENSITVEAGYNQLKDENLHSKVHRGLMLSTSYRHSEISKIISEYTAGLKFSLLNTIHEEFPSSVNIQLIGNYKYLFTVARAEKIAYYLGPNVDLSFGTSAFFNWDESHFYWANYLSGGIGNRITYTFGDKAVDFNLDFPLGSLISRPVNNRQYKIDDMTFGGILKTLSSNIEGAFPDKHFYITSGIELKTPARKGKKQSVGYTFRYNYMKAHSGEPFQHIEHSISYKFIF